MIKKINFAAVIIFGTLITFLTKDFRLDDALIYYRYIENVLNGNGLVYNIGERFNAISSPLYMYISILFSLITREVEITQLVLNGVLVIAAALILADLFYYLQKPYMAFVSSLIYVTSKIFYMTFGLESNLFVFLSLLCIIFYFKRKFYLLTVFSVLLILTRGEGLFLVLTLWGFIYFENRKDIKLGYIVLGAVILAANHLFNYYYYDSFLPHTLTAKMSQGESGYWGAGHSFLLNFNFLFRMAFNNQPFFILSLIIFSLIGFANHIKERLPLILFLYSIGITVFHVALNIQNYHWYYAVHFLTFFVFVSYGIVDAVSYLNSKIKKPSIKYAVIVLIFLYPALTQIELFRLLSREKPIEGYKAAGEWLRNNTSENVKIASVEIGHIGWYSKRYTVDILGLVNPGLADYVGKRQMDKWFEIYRPEYVLVHDPIAGTEVLAQKFIENGTYIEETAYKYQGLKLYKLSR